MIPSHYKDINIKSTMEMLRRAGQAIMDVYHSEDFGIEQKTDQSPVTKADLASNAVIVDYLSIEYPEINILSEEHTNTDYDKRKHWETCWIIDPLDGTKEFIHRGEDFCINLALVEGHEAIVGFVYLPVKEICYVGIVGQGAYKCRNDQFIDVKVSSFSIKQAKLRVPVSKNHLDSETREYIQEQFVAPSLITCGAGLKFANIAEGIFDIYPRLQRIMEWDVAAGHALIKAAGGNVLNLETGMELKYNQEDLRLPHFLGMGNFKADEFSLDLCY